MLEGSVRRSGNQLRVNAQLVDAETDVHLWAQRFDGDIGDLFALQDEVTSRIGNTLNRELIAAEAARPADHPDALDYILRARAVFTKGPAREHKDGAIGFYERALAIDPQSVEAQTWLAMILAARVREGQSDSPAADIERAEGLVTQALALAPRSARVHTVKGGLLQAKHRWDEAISEYETVLASDRNSAVSLAGIGICKVQTGLVDEAITWFEKARSISPGVPQARANLASAYGLKGETERAAAELAEAQRLSANDRFSSIARLKRVSDLASAAPKIRALAEATFFAGLRKAGMPEE